MTVIISRERTQRQSNLNYSKILPSLFLESDFIPSSYYYRGNGKEVRLFHLGPSSITIEDLLSKLLSSLLEERNKTVQMSSFRIQELLDWEGITKKLKALEEVIGLLDDLSDKELETFDNVVKRRPLFGNE